METQKFKSVSIREIVDCALHGKPINVQSRELFDLSDVDIDDESFIADEYSDPLEVESYFRNIAEEKFLSNYGKNDASGSGVDSHTKQESKEESKQESKQEPKQESKQESNKSETT